MIKNRIKEAVRGIYESSPTGYYSRELYNKIKGETHEELKNYIDNWKSKPLWKRILLSLIFPETLDLFNANYGLKACVAESIIDQRKNNKNLESAICH